MDIVCEQIEKTFKKSEIKAVSDMIYEYIMR